jgi:hypothetical protein
MIFGIIFTFSGKTFSKSFSKPDRLNATRTPDLYIVNTHETDRRAPHQAGPTWQPHRTGKWRTAEISPTARSPAKR